MSEVDRGLLLNAFSPAQEVVDPMLFAGRTEEVRQVADALRTTGSCPLIYGDRGLGKSSLAVQCQLMAMGDETLLHQTGSAAWKLNDHEMFLTFFVTCSDEVKTFADIQKRILNSLRGFTPDPGAAGKQVLVDRQTKRKVSFKVFEVESTLKYADQVKKLRDEDLSPTEHIEREVNLLVETYGQRVLVIIDELDRVSSTAGIASFIKTMSSDKLKFVLVGIAQSISDLGLDHQSIDRNLWPIRLPRMQNDELTQIITLAEARLVEQGIGIAFDAPAKRKLVSVAGGFPWFVHVIGQAALIDALDEMPPVVSVAALNRAVESLARNRFAQRFNDMYQRAVRESSSREILLRLLAAYNIADIPTSAIYPLARNLGVSNPAVYKGHLCSATYGAPLMAPGFQERGLVRFRDEMFKRYVSITRSLFQDVDENVREAYKVWQDSLR